MYKQSQLVFGRSSRVRYCAKALAILTVLACQPIQAQQLVSNASSEFTTPNIIRHISRDSERLEMTTNASRILTLDMNIPKVQVNNPELVAVTPLSATQVQVSAKKPGVTQINLWDENGKVHTLDVVIYGDVRELEHALSASFPNSSIAVRKYSNSLMLTGFVDSPDHVDPMLRLAEDYAPKVINSLEVGGVQQVLLKVKIFEVSRTKLRRLGVDWAFLDGSGDFVVSSVSGLIGDTFGTPVQSVSGSGPTFSFGVTGSNSEFFAFLDALQQNSIAKILAEPNIVSVSGRPAQFLEGGEVPIIVPQGLGTAGIEYKPFGTQVDFLPIVLGNGNIRLEVRPRVSDLDESIGIDLQSERVPGFRVRQADTAVEMRAGQTFALAGLIQQRTQAVNRGLPWLSDLPVLGVPFRKVEEEVEEVELLILVTPEFVDAMDPHEVPPCGPGMGTMSPDNCSLYIGGHLEVPNAYSPCGNQGCNGGGCNAGGCNTGNFEGGSANYPMMTPVEPTPATSEGNVPYSEQYEQVPSAAPIHGELQMPDVGAQNRPRNQISPRTAANVDGSAGYTMPRTANFQRVPTNSAPPQVPVPSRSEYSIEGGLIGPVGYDVD